jgi:hypothetical protein
MRKFSKEQNWSIHSTGNTEVIIPVSPLPRYDYHSWRSWLFLNLAEMPGNVI